MKSLLVTALPIVLATGCLFNKPPKTVVNGGDSTPIEDREDGVPWDGIREHHAVVAYEAGRCEVDSDCMQQSCSNAVCGARGVQVVCLTSLVSECLGELETEQCGCNQGVCRWQRSPVVLECAALAEERAESRPYYGGGGAAYPSRPGAPTTYTPAQ